MNFYVRKLRFKKNFFNKKIYIKFEFYLGDTWRKGKVLFECNNPNTSVSYVSLLITTYITNYISNKRSAWTLDEARVMAILLEQFGKDIIGDSTKLFK